MMMLISYNFCSVKLFRYIIFICIYSFQVGAH